jgi:pimeloyl-ACP methyl ester carboxylesterase
MQPLVIRLIEALMCVLVLTVFLAIYLSKQALTRWAPRVPEAPPCTEHPALNSDGTSSIPVLLIHGYASSPSTFTTKHCIAPLLQAGHPVVLPTYRPRTDGPNVSLGRVLSHSLLACLPRDALPVSIETMAADLVVLIAERGWDKVHLVGHSMGGMVAQAVAIEIPERVASLTTVGSCTGPGLGPCTPRVIQLVRDGMRVMHPAFWQRLTGDIGGASGEGRREEVSTVGDVSRTRQGRSEWGQRQVAAIITSRSRAKKLDTLVRRGRLHAPILAVSGDQDARISPASAAAMGRQITGCRSVVVGGMGHSPKGDEWTEVLRLAGLVGHDAVLQHVHTAKDEDPGEYKDSDVDVLAPDPRTSPAAAATDTASPEPASLCHTPADPSRIAEA